MKLVGLSNPSRRNICLLIALVYFNLLLVWRLRSHYYLLVLVATYLRFEQISGLVRAASEIMRLVTIAYERFHYPALRDFVFYLFILRDIHRLEIAC